MSTPSTRTCPRSGRMSPIMCLSITLLPAPPQTRSRGGADGGRGRRPAPFRPPAGKIPLERADPRDDQPEDKRFDKPVRNIIPLHARLHLPEEDAGVYPEELYPHHVPSQNPHDVEYRREERHGHKGPEEPGGGEELDRGDPHRLQRFDLLADPHDPDLRGQGGGGPAGHQ